MVPGNRDSVEKLKAMKIKGSARDQPSSRMIQIMTPKRLSSKQRSISAGESELTRKRGRHRQARTLVMELLHRYSVLKHRMIAGRFGGFDEGLVGGDRRAIRDKIET
jgi:hypothetical protein